MLIAAGARGPIGSMRGWVVAVVAVAGCSKEPCEAGEPGMHVVIHFETDANGPVVFYVEYASGMTDHFEDQVPREDPATGSFPPLLDFAIPYRENAVDGPARATFIARPDQANPGADADFVADLESCVLVEMTVIDPGPP